MGSLGDRPRGVREVQRSPEGPKGRGNIARRRAIWTGDPVPWQPLPLVRETIDAVLWTSAIVTLVAAAVVTGARWAAANNERVSFWRELVEHWVNVAFIAGVTTAILLAAW